MVRKPSVAVQSSEGDRGERIVDVAIALAEEIGWENVRLRIVAQRLGISLAEIGRHYRDLDAIANAWFARARHAMLAPVPDGFFALSPRERVSIVMLRWFDALAPHRRVTVEMLRTKLWPFHPHHWVPMIFDLSRTILWVRDAAGLDAKPPRREIEEVGLSWLFVATLAVWAGDESENQERTRRFLDRRLGSAECALWLISGEGGLPRRGQQPNAGSPPGPA